MLDLMMLIHGAHIDEFRSKIPADILELTQGLKFMDKDLARSLRQSAIDASIEMHSAPQNFNPEPLPTTRAALGFKTGASGAVNASNTNVIDMILEKIKPEEESFTIETLFGSRLAEDTKNGTSRTTSAPLCHAMLNMIGYYPDGGLSDQEKQAAIMADGNHIAYGSYCDYLLTSDKRMLNKANAIYEYKQYPSNVGKLKYNNDGMELLLVDPAILDQLPGSEIKEFVRSNPIMQTK